MGRRIDINKIGSPSLKLQDINGVGIAVPTNPNSTSIHRPKPRNRNPLSHLIAEDSIEDKDNPEIKPPQTKTKNLEVNINNNEKYLHNQDETIKKEKQYQRRASLSDFKNTSRRPEDNRYSEKDDQDQEESIDNDSGVKEPADQRVEPKIFLKSDLGNGKVAVSALAPENGHGYSRRHNLDSEPKIGEPINYDPKKSATIDIEDYRQSRRLLNYDIDENWQTRFWKRAMQEKEEQLKRLRLIEHHQGLLEKQRQGLLELKQSLDKQSAAIKAQQVEAKEIEPLIPQLIQLKDAGVDFTLLMQIVATLNEAAVFQNVDLKTAAYNVGQMIRACRDLGGVNQEVERTQAKLSDLEIVCAQILEIRATLQVAGITEKDIVELVSLKRLTPGYSLDNNFKLDTELFGIKCNGEKENIGSIN